MDFRRFAVLLAVVTVCFANALGATLKVPLKTGWRFVKADDPAAGTNLTHHVMSEILDRADRGDLSGAPDFSWAKPSFDDSSWRQVRVPHDWGVDSPFDSDRPYGDAFLDVTGIGWYRLKLSVPADWKGMTVYFECDGAMSYAMAYVNGKFLGGWPYGYTRWRLDL
jgi:beta-galactosidase